MRIGYKLATEGFGPRELIRQAVLAEQAGFDFVEMSDHYHPWVEAQGHSAFTWNLLSAIAMKTDRIGLATGVTCPSMRYHPAIIAQAAATLAIISDGRFTLGVGAGERLNEHVTGEGFPARRVRHERFREALEIIRLLWQGGYRSYDGRYLKLEDARVFDLPEELPVIAVAASGPESAKIAAELGDGLFAVEPDGEPGRHVARAGRPRPGLRRDAAGLGRRRGHGRSGGAGEERLRAERLEGHGGTAQPGQLRVGHRACHAGPGQESSSPAAPTRSGTWKSHGNSPTRALTTSSP